MICPSCGGEFAEWAHKCPYCGTYNEEVDEELYMQHMYELRERLDSVDEEAEETYRGIVNASSKKTVKRIIIVLIIAAVLASGFFLIRALRFNSMEKKAEDIEMWEKTEFPKLDVWYDAGEYDKIIEEYYSLADKKDKYYVYIYRWEHGPFIIDYYDRYRLLKEEIKEINDPDFTGKGFTMGLTIWDSMLLLYGYEMNIDKLHYDETFKADLGDYYSEEEKEMIVGYRREAHDYIFNTLGMTYDDLNEIVKAKDEGKKSGLEICVDLGKEMMGENG